MKKRFLFLIALGLMALGATAQVYTVTCEALPTEGGSVTASPASAGSGEDVTLTVTPNTGYRIGAVSVNEETSGNAVAVTGEGQSRTFSMPAANVAVTASFAKEYAVKQADGIENGTLTISSTTALEFDDVTITVEPGEGYQLTEGSLKVNDGAVSVKAGSGANEYTFEMPDGDATVSAAFEKVKYAVAADANIQNGAIDVTTSPVAWGETVTIKVNPEEGYELVELSLPEGIVAEQDESDNTKYSFEMPKSAVTIGATFQKVKYNLVFSNVDGGSVTPDHESPIAWGEEVTLTVIPDEGYQLTEGSLKVNDGNVTLTADNKFTMPKEDAMVSAAFEKVKYAVTADANIQNGTIDITTSPVAWGETVTIKVNPEEGYELVELSLPEGIVPTQDESDNTKYSFEMPKAAVTISAEFEKITYTLTLPTLEGGNVTADKTSPVAWGEEVVLTISANSGYKLDGDVTAQKLDDGEVLAKGSESTLTFTMPQAAVAVEAKFEKIKYNVKVQVPAGVLTVSKIDPTSPIAWGETVTATVQVAEGYVLQSVKAYQETVKGTEDVSTATEISVVDALAKIEKMSKNEESSDYYLISGTVSNWSVSSKKGTFMLNDGEKSIKIYSVSYIDETPFGTSNALAAGDRVKVYGKLKNYNGKTPELLSGYVVEHSVAVAVTEGEGGACSFEMPKANVNIEVEAKKLNAITLSILPDNEAGSATLSATSVIEGTEISISGIAAKEGYELGTVVAKQGDVDIEVKDNKFTMPDGEVTVTVTFNKLYAISIDTEIANGEVKASKESAVKDSEIALTVTPAKGYQLVEGSLTVKNGEESVEVKDNKFTMPEADVKVSASFEKVSYTISVAEEIEGGKVEVEGALKTAQMGDSVALKATAADEFYTFSKYVVTCADGDDKGEVVVNENGKFAMPAGIVLVSAEFAKVKFNITIAESENGAVEVAETSVAWGEEVALTIKPADGYMLDSVVVKQGDTKVEVANNKFTMPKGDVNIEAAFKEKQGTTISDVLAAGAKLKENGQSSEYYQVTGEVLYFKASTKHGNADMVIKDETGVLYCWRTYDVDSANFTKEDAILAGDTVTVRGMIKRYSSLDISSMYADYDSDIEMSYGVLIDPNADDSGEIATLDVTCTTVEAYNYEDYYEVGGESILMYIETEDESNGVQFEVITAEGTGIGENALPAGTYEIVDSESAAVGTVISGVYWEDYDQYDGAWWFDYENEMSYSLVSGTVTITEADGVYTIVVDALTEDGGSVKAIYTGAVEIEEGEYTAIRDIEVMSDVYARDGRIYAEEGARIYTVTGIDVTTLNGQLDGVYVVKNGNKVAKVVVR